MNEFEKLKELIKDNPDVPVILKIKGTPEKNFDCRYYLTEAYIYNNSLLTEDEFERELVEKYSNDEDCQFLDHQSFSQLIYDNLMATESTRVIILEVY